jgi:uncharacterized protein (DUF1778 family)
MLRRLIQVTQPYAPGTRYARYHRSVSPRRSAKAAFRRVERWPTLVTADRFYRSVLALCIHVHANFMAKPRLTSDPAKGPVAVAERSRLADTKGSINLRIETQTRQLIDEAAAILGKTRTEFMVDSARALAIDVLLDQRLFVLDAARYDAFVHALDNPPAPGPKLRALLRRKPAWEA